MVIFIIDNKNTLTMGNVKKTFYKSLPQDAKPIPDYPTYYATPDGKIWRDHKNRVAEILPHKRRSTYYQVQPFVNNKRVVRYVHRLVLSAFKGKCPDGYECHHKDHNPSNNHISNLQWTTVFKNRSVYKRKKP